MRAARERDPPIAVGLATDVGGGSSFSMFETMKAAYEISQLKGYSLHPAQGVLSGHRSAAPTSCGSTTASAIWRPATTPTSSSSIWRSRPLIAQRMQQVDSLWDALFLQIILADDRAVRATYIAGRKPTRGRVPADNGG